MKDTVPISSFGIKESIRINFNSIAKSLHSSSVIIFIIFAGGPDLFCLSNSISFPSKSPH